MHCMRSPSGCLTLLPGGGSYAQSIPFTKSNAGHGASLCVSDQFPEKGSESIFQLHLRRNLFCSSLTTVASRVKLSS